MVKRVNPKAIKVSQELEKSDKKALSVKVLSTKTGYTEKELLGIATSQAYKDYFEYLNKDKSIANYNGEPTIVLKKALTIQEN